MRRSLAWSSAVAVVVALLVVGCEEGARHARAVVHDEHAPRVATLVREDLARGMTGVRRAATKLAPGFLVEDPAQRVHDMHAALAYLRQLPRGISELVVTPMSFVAVVGLDGVVIARDIEPDPMAGMDVGALYPLVRRALDTGAEGYELVEFAATDPNDPPSPVVLFAAPAVRSGRRVGAVIAGTPLWRESQRLSRQLQAEGVPNPTQILWVYLYRGDSLYHHATPEDLTSVVPDGAARAAGLAASPGGFTGELVQFGRWYAYGVLPLPSLGPDVGAVIFRSDPL